MHDLRSRRTRELLEGIEDRHREARSNLALKLAAGIAFVVFLIFCTGFAVLFAMGLRARVVGYAALPAAGAIGAGAWQILERTLYRPKFPFLTTLPPADRP